MKQFLPLIISLSVGMITVSAVIVSAYLVAGIGAIINIGCLIWAAVIYRRSK